ncbi:hypothetical protein EMCRGX_G028604 [Ephydatia muelleri]
MALQDLVGNVDDYEFEIEAFLAKQLGARPMPFPGMDKNKAALCEFFIEGTCARGANCPFRHVRGERTIVCKHWLRHLCKKGDDCEFLHEYDMTKMPICYFFQKFGECNNKDCQYLHIDAESLKVRECPWYDRGFCKHGPNCRNRHTRRVLCQNYLCGFCPDGLKCKFIHAKFETPVAANIMNMPSLPPPIPSVGMPPPQPPPTSLPSKFPAQLRRPLDQVTCFKCGEKGHYANMCPKSYRAQMSANVGVK